MAGNEGLFKAIGMFNESMTGLATSKAVNDTREKINALQTDVQDQLAQRVAAQRLAKDLQLNLIGIGASASSAAAAGQAAAPKELNNAQDYMLEGLASKSVQLQQIGQRLQKFEKQPQFDILNQQQGFQASESQKDRDHALLLASMKSSNKELKSVPAPQLEKIQELDSGAVRGKELLATFKADPYYKENIGPVAGVDIVKSIRDPKFGAFKADVGRWFDEYRKQITGAATTDKELRALKENTPNMTDTPALFQKKIENIVLLGKQVKQKRLQNLRRAKYDVTEFNTNASPELQGAQEWLKANPAHPKAAAVQEKIRRMVLENEYE